MNDQNRLRLSRIAARHASRPAPAPTAPEPPPEEEDALAPAFLAAFARARDAVLRPAMAEVGLELKDAGHGFRIDTGGDEKSPSIDLRVILPDRGDSRDTVRFLAKKDAERGWQVVGELELKGSPVELTRFETAEEITHDVVEQLVVDAVEQMLASTAEAPRAKSPPRVPAPAPPAAPAPPVAPPPPAVEIVAAPPAPTLLAKPEPMGSVPTASPTFLQAPPARTGVLLEPASLKGTSTGFFVPHGGTLPFAPGVAGAPTLLPATPPPSRPMRRAPAELSGTSLAAPVPTGPVVPFAPATPAAPPSPPLPPAPAAPVPQRRRAPAELSGTSLAAPVPAGPAVPFAPAVAGAPPGPPASTVGHAAPASRRTRAPAELGGTLDPVAAPTGPQLPFARAPEPPAPGGLSLEQYASLCVELTFEPAKADDTLLRYRLTSEQRKALDEHWQARMTADPSVWMRFDQAYTAYQRWYVASRQR